MMLVRRSWPVVLAFACAVAALAGCSSGAGPVCACPAAPPRAYALDVTTAGRVRWQVPLARAGESGSLSPLAVGAVAVFAQGNAFAQGHVLSQGDVLHGLRLADGHQLWTRVTSRPIAGMWRWRNLVVVLTQNSGVQQQVLTGLDASSGQARWTLPLGGDADGFSPTADGGLAILRRDGVLEVVDLSSGRVRWTRPVGSNGIPPVAVGGGAVLFTANSQLTSYDDRTGRVRWAEALKPWLQPPLQAFAGLVYLQAEVQQAQPTYTAGLVVLLGISAADGRVKWRFTPSQPQSLDVYAPGLMSAGASQDELDPATGRVRWHVASPYRAIATPAGVIVTAPGPDLTDQISVRDALTGQTRWTAGLSEPPAAGPGQISPAPPVFPAGPLLVVPALSLHGSGMLAAFRMSDGHRAWQVTIPARVAAPLSGVPGGMLVYTG
jgi:outer membrane protein assembly factor BamB